MDRIVGRTVSWFSCGAASAVATKLAIASGDKINVVYCEVKEEHPDNARFLKDCEEWFGQEIEVLGNDNYNRSIYEVFSRTRYLSGPAGARCTGELKKRIREQYEKPTDRQVFGYTLEEQSRVDRFRDANADVNIWPILIEEGLTKQDCIAIVNGAGIEVPAMYKLGYKNNNCVGCVKASSPAYWKKIQQDFPEMFERMNEAEKELGRSVCKIDMKTVKKKYPEHYSAETMYWRPQLHELPDDIIAMDNTLDVQCGIYCHMAEEKINPYKRAYEEGEH